MDEPKAKTRSSSTVDVSTDRSTEALLTQYRELREDIRTFEEIQNRRITQGIAAVGFIAGYSLVSDATVYETRLLLTLIPLVIAFVFVRNVGSINEIHLRADHARTIESGIPVRDFAWESRYGETGTNRREEVYPLRHAVYISAMAIGFIVYVGSVFVSIAFAPREQLVAGISVRMLLYLGYGLVTALVIASAVSHYSVMKNTQRDEEDAARGENSSCS